MNTAIEAAQPTEITVGSGSAARRIACLLRPGDRNRPALFWLSGYRSDMLGSKAVEMDRLAADCGLASIRFDYSGHGQSGGSFRDGTISLWLEEALAVFEAAGAEKVLIIGSSMGGWIALRLVQELRRSGRASAIAGLVLVAPAPDFTRELIAPALTEAQRQSLQSRGYFEEPSEYSPEPNVFTRNLMEDGERNSVLDGLIETGAPVHILQGMKDEDVPFGHALRLVEHLPAEDTVLTLIRDGDHRLSRPQDLERLAQAIRGLVDRPAPINHVE